jgi:hypothetical protein
MAFSITTPENDKAAEATVAAAFKTDPGASPHGQYIDSEAAINMSSAYPNLRFLVVGNKHDCKEPIKDFYPSPGNANVKLALAHPWQKSSPESIGGGMDVMGGNGPGEMSATCWYFGMELHDTQKVPIGLIHSSYGGSAVEDWISKETLGDGQSGPCPGPIPGSMGLPSQQFNGQLRPLMNTTIKGAIWYQVGAAAAAVAAAAAALAPQLTLHPRPCHLLPPRGKATPTRQRVQGESCTLAATAS